MSNVTKKDLIDAIVRRTGQKRVVVKDVLQLFLDSVVDELGIGNRIELRDFGVFEVRKRAQRIGRNPMTGEKVPVEARCSVKFKPGRLMKDKVQDAAAERAEDGVAGHGSTYPTHHQPAGTPIVTQAGQHYLKSPPAASRASSGSESSKT